MTAVGWVVFVGFAGVVAWQQWPTQEQLAPTERAHKNQEIAPVAPTPAPASARRTLKPLDTFTDCRECPEMVVIPGGTFTMGSPADEEGDRKGHIKKPQLLGAAGVSSEVWILKVEHLPDTDFPTASQARKRQAAPGGVFCT